MPIKSASPILDLRKMIHLVFGDPKAGKSTLVSTFPDLVFVATEKGLDHVPCARWETADGRYVVNSWDEFVKAVEEVIASGAKTVAIDTIGNACALADEHVCKMHGEEYKGDGKLGYGKGTTMIANVLKRFLTNLSGRGIGVVLIAHATTRTISNRAGEVQKRVPLVPGDNKAAELYTMILGMCDTILFVDVEPNGDRVLRTKPSSTYDAGDRSGRMPASLKIPADNSKGFGMIYESFYGKPYTPKVEPAPGSNPAENRETKPADVSKVETKTA